MLPDAVRRLVDDWALKPGERAVVVGADERGRASREQLRARRRRDRRASSTCAPTQPARIAATGAAAGSRSVELDGERIDCDLLVVSGGRQPAYSLLAQAGARVEYDAAARHLRPDRAARRASRSSARVAGELGSRRRPAPSSDGARRQVLRLHLRGRDDEGREARDRRGLRLDRAREALHDRDDGPVPGQALPARRRSGCYARETGTDESAIGTTTARPPWTPVELGLLAGRHYEPVQAHAAPSSGTRTLGAKMMWTGAWRRPHSYGDPAAEVRAVHEALGVIDVSTLGKILVEGPDAAAFLERLYPNRFSDLKVGPHPLRRAHHATAAGSWTTARSPGSTTSSSTSRRRRPAPTASRVVRVVERGLGLRRRDRQRHRRARRDEPRRAAGARGARARSPTPTSRNEALPLPRREARSRVAGVPCLALRIGFVGELGYELHCPSPHGEHLWDALVAARRARRSGSSRSASSGSRRAHVIVGQDTDSESNLLSAGMPWIVKLDKDDFVGKWAARARPRARCASGSSASRCRRRLPAEGAQVVRDGRLGRPRHERARERARRAGDRARLGRARPRARTARRSRSGSTATLARRRRVTLAPFYDPEGALLRS